MSRNKQFKAESKRLLDLMINSIYTHKEIFLRELISNASDALDKLNYLSFNEEGIDRENLKIKISTDEQNKTIIISDNGIGMNESELEENLGTIAKSGSLAFKQELDENKKDDVDIIGQFGVGFYAAFMVAKEVVVESKKYNEEKAYRWVSDGSNGYRIDECDKADRGTTITLFLKDDTKEENYSDFAKQFKIETLVKKYSDYIRYPITMMVSKYEGEGDDKQLVVEEKTLNSMVPLWKRKRSEIKNDKYRSPSG